MRLVLDRDAVPVLLSTVNAVLYGRAHDEDRANLRALRRALEVATESRGCERGSANLD